MKIVLLSGGSVKRLWPLSNNSRSKQFLKLLKNERGDYESMLQRVWRQLISAGLADSTVIAAGKEQADIIHGQLRQAPPVIVEPEQRDTFPAICLAASYLHSALGVNDDEIVFVMPVDAFVELDFFMKLEEMDAVMRRSSAELGLIGIRPSAPSAKYGYIVPKAPTDERPYYEVESFTEKPFEPLAEKLVKQGALWNSGIFAFSLGRIVSLLKARALPIHYEALMSQYGSLPKISFDYEVAEKSLHKIVIRYDGKWNDLGTWNSLTEQIESPVLGHGIISTDSVNTHLVNELDIPVTILGVSNIVVAASPDGILVADKRSSPKIKDLMADFHHRPMFEERDWGNYSVLNHSLSAEGAETVVKRIVVKAGHHLYYRCRLDRSEVWTMTGGRGKFVLNGAMKPVKAGDTLFIPARATYGIKAVTDLELIEVRTGSTRVEEDDVPIAVEWDDVEAICQHAAYADSLR